MVKNLFVGLVFAAALSSLGYSQPRDGMHLQKFIEKLNLTDEQKKDVEKIHFETQKQTIAQTAKIATSKVELHQLLKADVPDKSAIEKKLNEIADQGVQLHMIKINSWFAINKFLNPEQQKQWKNVLEQGPKMMKRRMMRQGMHRPPMAPLFDTPEPESPAPALPR
jgi:Spy/CpxP family protein refolding chaperone